MASNQGGYGSRISHLRQGLFKNIIKVLYPPAPFVNIISSSQKKKIKNDVFGTRGQNLVLDVGSGLSKGPGAWLWKGESTKSITRVDLVDGPNVDLVADATNLPIQDEYFDSIVLQSVVEHVGDMDQLIKECVRVLKKGGVIYVEMPFLQGVHGDPDDFWRMTANGLAKKIDDYGVKRIASGISGGVIGAIIWLLTDFLSNISGYYPFDSGVRFFFRWLLAPVRYLDFPLKNTVASRRLAVETFFLGAKL